MQTTFEIIGNARRYGLAITRGMIDVVYGHVRSMRSPRYQDGTFLSKNVNIGEQLHHFDPIEKWVKRCCGGIM